MYQYPKQYSQCDITSRTALKEIPENAPNSKERKLSEKVVKRLSYILPGENVWQAEERLGDKFPRVKDQYKDKNKSDI